MWINGVCVCLNRRSEQHASGNNTEGNKKWISSPRKLIEQSFRSLCIQSFRGIFYANWNFSCWLSVSRRKMREEEDEDGDLALRALFAQTVNFACITKHNQSFCIEGEGFHSLETFYRCILIAIMFHQTKFWRQTKVWTDNLKGCVEISSSAHFLKHKIPNPIPKTLT